MTGLKSFICETDPSVESVHWEPLIGDLSKWSAMYSIAGKPTSLKNSNLNKHKRSTTFKKQNPVCHDNSLSSLSTPKAEMPSTSS